MLRQRAEKTGRGWIVLGLSLHVVAAAVLVTNGLASSAERRAGEASETDPTARRATPETALAEAPPPKAEQPRPERIPLEAPALDPALRVRVAEATEALVAALDHPEFEDAIWREEVHSRAEELGPEALPALQELLADDARSPEEHVAAVELVQALAR